MDILEELHIHISYMTVTECCYNTEINTGECVDAEVVLILSGGGEIAQSLVSLSIKQAVRVRARLDPLVIERWNSITVLLTCSHQCRRPVKKRQSMCYYVCVIMHVKDP